MATKHILTILLGTSLLFNACKKEETPTTNNNTPTDGQLTITFDNMVGNDPLEMSMMKFTNAAANNFSVSLLKYYVSNIEIKKKDGTVHKPGVYKLIDGSNLSTCSFDAGKLTAGDYDSMIFYIGIDQSKNHTGAQDGDLDVSKGMFWTWNTGYIFFKHEGQYKNSSNQTKSLILHYGTDDAYTKIKMPITLNINGNKNMHIKFDLNSVYTSPTNIDFNIDNNRQSSSSADAGWIFNMNNNFQDAFTFSKVE